MEAGLDMERIRTATLTKDEWVVYEMAVSRVREWPLYVNDRSGLTVAEIRSIATMWHMKHKIKMLAVDYLQLAHAGNVKTVGSREQEVSYISGSMKVIAKELEIPVLALSQMSREMEKRDAKSRRPQLSDLRDSGSLEQDADSVIFIFRPEKHGILTDEDGNSTEGFTELIVSKNRMGALGILKARFEGQYSRFVDESTYPHSYSKVTHEPEKSSSAEDMPF
jgi:replicative DNA helicase